MALCLALAPSPAALGQTEIDPAKAGAEVEKLQERMRDDPEIMEAVEELRGDPAMRELLEDPSVADALRSGDVGTLLLNPKVQDLMEHPAVEDITRELGD